MKKRKDYNLPYGHTIVVPKSFSKIPHMFFYNETYNDILCVITGDDGLEIDAALNYKIIGKTNFLARAVSGAVGCNIGNKIVERQCFYVILRNGIDDCLPLTHGTIAHEAIHICQFMMDGIGGEIEGDEQCTYFGEWVTNCIYTFLYGNCVIDKSKWIINRQEDNTF